LSSSSGQLINVNIEHPGQSTVYMETPGYNFWGLVSPLTGCGQHIIYGIQSSPYSDSSTLVAIDMFTKSVIGNYSTIPVNIYDAASIDENGGGFIIPANPFTASDTVVCTGTPLILDAGNAGSSYVWDDNSTGELRTVYSSGKYYVTVTNANGCSISDSITCNFVNGPVINLPADTAVCNEEKLILNASYLQTTYLWQDGSTLPEYTVSKAGLFSVEATDKCGTVTKVITVKSENCNCTLSVPSAFTPNHDGVNDLFMPVNKCIGDDINNYELRIFNRWGQLIFDSHNISFGWDGTYVNHPQPAGGYIWQINYTNRLNDKIAYKSGTVVLIR
jgi:gliding motility-associated-like protein